VNEICLTHWSPAGGCACKLRAATVEHLTSAIGDAGRLTDSEDAAIVELADGSLLYVTIDVMTPVVDQARQWGRVVAANCLSDVYAMNGRPTVAVAFVGWPDDLSLDLLVELHQGAQEVLAEAGVALVGGHSITDQVPKFGLTVLGTGSEDTITRNGAAEAGQVLVLSKPLGTGAVNTASRAGVAEQAARAEALAVMTQLNAGAARVGEALGVRAATDVTGFGLIGHAHELARSSGVQACLHLDDLPVLDDARPLIAAGYAPDGARRNLADAGGWLVPGGCTEEDLLLVADPQTSGGLLQAVEPDRADELVAALVDAGYERSAVVGHLQPGDVGRVVVMSAAGLASDHRGAA
jgi:selenide,water dikinase